MLYNQNHTQKFPVVTLNIWNNSNSNSHCFSKLKFSLYLVFYVVYKAHFSPNVIFKTLKYSYSFSL